MRMKRRVFLTCVVPSILYGCEIWSLRAQEQHKLAVVQRRMERSMLGLSLLDRVSNEMVRRVTALPDILDMAWSRKLKWASKLARLEEGRWSKATTEWYPRGGRRNVGRPCTKWEDDIKRAQEQCGRSSTTWMRDAREEGNEWTRTLRAARNL